MFIPAVCFSKLNFAKVHITMAFNTWAVAGVRCTAGTVNWTIDGLKSMDRKIES